MVSEEFRSVIENKNLLRARIILKDSLVLDPTFVQFDEMLRYAKQRLPDILMEDDGADLNDKEVEWDQAQMNLELVQIVHNFSERKIQHLKKMIRVIRAEDIRARQEKQEKREKQQRSARGSYQARESQNTREGMHSAETRMIKSILGSIVVIEMEMLKMDNFKNIDMLEEEAEKLLMSIREYKEKK